MRFTKMHGAANDYLFIDARQLDADWPDLAVAMSDRHRGVGSDGIILVLPSEQAQLRMRIFNADGSEGEMCGNGIRCFAKYAIERGLAEANGSGPAGGDVGGCTHCDTSNDGRAHSRRQGSHGASRTPP